MNAINFIQQHGVENARECIEEANAYGGFWVNAKTMEISDQIPSYDAVSIPDIQRLVESIDLIRKVGDVSNAKLILSGMDYDSVDWDEDQFSYYRLLEQAIADYEAIGGDHV